MSRWIGALLSAVALAALLAEDELPQPEEAGPIEIEPPLLIQSRGPDGLPIVAGAGEAAPPDVDLAKLETNLTRAKKRAAGADHLYRAGIIAKVEAEDRALKVIRLEAELAEARLQAAKRKVEEEKASESVVEAGESKDKREVVQATEVAERAAEERRRAELEAALRNLQRQQKLLALGSGRKADVNRAEQKLAELQRARE